jgi:hypothetical protein
MALLLLTVDGLPFTVLIADGPLFPTVDSSPSALLTVVDPTILLTADGPTVTDS